MAAKLKVDQVESVDGSSNITINNSVTMAANQTLPAASLTGTVPTASLGSGTANTTVFLRGDGSWQTAGSTSASDLTSGTLPIARIADDAIVEAKIGPGAVVTAAINDDAVTTAKINANAVGLTELAGIARGKLIYGDSGGDPAVLSPGSADQILTSNGTDIAWATAAAGGLSEADQWRLTSNVTLGNDLVSWLTANWERCDTNSFGRLGTGLSESSGVFSFPSTGVWLIIFNVNGHIFNTHTRYYNATIYTTTNNSSYASAALAQTNGYHSGNVGTYFSASTTFMFDVTNTSTHKFKMQVLSIAGGFVQSSTGSNRTCITAIKLGDT
jgi:hypothetical protein